jgi:splicing factor 3B subunit 3
MYFYNLTLKESTAITHAVVGQFSGKRDDFKKGFFEIAVAKGKVLEILKPDESTGKLNSLISVNVFGIIRSMAAFRLTGGMKDYLAIGSESGRLVILEYLPEKSRFDKVHQETFGRSGMRRIVPGQYLACDSKGRAVMIGAVEKQKLVYQLNRDTQANLTISSPLEAHKANTFVFHMINVDVGYENPLFACLEVDYEEADEDPTGRCAKETKQNLTYYELDLGLNHVVRKYSEQLDEYANLLIPVPGGNDGPSGLILCSENYLTYKNFGEQADIKCPIPRRKGETDVPERGILIACWATYKYVDAGQRKFFFFIQTELGDVFKTELEIDEEIVTDLKMTYFETLPVATSLCLLPQSRRHVEGGLLFVGAEAGNHKLYQIDQADDGEDDEKQTFSHRLYCEIQEAIKTGRKGFDEDNKFFQFKTRPLKNLVLVDEVQSMAPILAATSYNRLDEHRMLVACGSKSNSSLRVLRHGLEVSERAMSTLPSMATGIWSIRKRCDSVHDEYIVVSFTNATLVLGVGETIDEILDSGFLATKTTLCCTQLGDDSLVQVHPDGIRHIHADKRVSEWRTPFKRQIVKCALNQRQIAIALSNHEVLYFEMDTTGQLNEYNERKVFQSQISCMALGEIPPGEIRSQFLAVGVDQKVTIISLDLNDCMSEITRQTFSSTAESITIAELGGGSADLNYTSQLYLNVGLQSGELVRTRLDRVSGDLSEPIRRYLGTKPVNLFNIRLKAGNALLACTNKSWLVYTHQNRCHLSPISSEPFESASSFSSPQVSEGIVAISGCTLRVLTLERLGDIYNQQQHDLEATPRRFVVHPQSGNVVAMLTDRLPLLIKHDSESDRWRSMIKLIDPAVGKVLQEVIYESDQAALSIELATFGTPSAYIHVGVSTGYRLRTNSSIRNEIYTYSISSNGLELQFVHKTECEAIPRVMRQFQDRLVVGIGRILRIYDLGKKKLLRKCESKQVPHLISTISVHSNRLFVGDVQESITFMKYRKVENVLSVFADDTYPRYLVSAGVFDFNTVICGDKFGNICVLQLPSDCNDDLDDDPTGTKSLWDRGWLGGASQKADNVATFHIGEIVTSIQKTTLTVGRADCVLYTTISGSIGALIQFEHKEDFEFFQTLEMHLRNEDPPLCGRDHLAFRSSYFPIKNIIDGDLCERYLALEPSSQQKIAEELERELGEICLFIDQMIEKII